MARRVKYTTEMRPTGWVVVRREWNRPAVTDVHVWEYLSVAETVAELYKAAVVDFGAPLHEIREHLSEVTT